MRTLSCTFIAAGLVCGAASATELAVNGDFETGNLSGWTQFGDTGFSGVATGAAHAGTYGAFFGPVNNTGGIRQTITAAIGDVVTVSFWVRLAGGAPNYFSASLGGSSLMTVIDQATAQPYTQFTFSNISITSNNPMLSFTFRHSPSFHFLDDVSVQTVDGPAVPLPTGAALASAGLALIASRRRR